MEVFTCVSVIDVLALQEVKQNVAAVVKLSGALRTLSDLYVVSTFRLPPKLGGVLLGVYNKQDNKKYLEVAIIGKINKGIGPNDETSGAPELFLIISQRLFPYCIKFK